MDLDRNGLERLSEPECLALLGSTKLGRVGLSVDALPVVLPVCFVLVGREILIRTGEGSKLDAAWKGSIVAFEADSLDGPGDQGWSVMVQGPAEVLGSPLELSDRALALPAPLPGNESDLLVAVRCDLVSGRRLPAVWSHPDGAGS